LIKQQFIKNNTPQNIRWGIIGLGKMAARFATDMATLENSEIFAVASKNEENAVNFAQKFNVKKTYTSYLDLAKDTGVDAVFIATPHSFHKAHTIRCLENKKAVLCEKPFAMNLQEVTEMICVAKEHKVLLMEALWTYFLPHYRYVLESIKSRRFGNIKTLEADFGFYTPYNTESRLFKKELGGGSLLDIGIYPVFAALSTIGKPNTIVSKASFFENGADASCEMVFNYKNAKAILKSTLLEETKTEAIFTFENAIIKINSRFHQPSTVTISKDGKKELIDFGYKTMGYNFEIEHFNTLVRENKTESDIMTFSFSKDLIHLLDRVRERIGLVY